MILISELYSICTRFGSQVNKVTTNFKPPQKLCKYKMFSIRIKESRRWNLQAHLPHRIIVQPIIDVFNSPYKET